MTELKQCHVKKYIPIEYLEGTDLDGTPTQIQVAGTGVLSDFIYPAYFHEWVLIDGKYVRGIVQYNDGTVDCRPMEHIEFVL